MGQGFYERLDVGSDWVIGEGILISGCRMQELEVQDTARCHALRCDARSRQLLHRTLCNTNSIILYLAVAPVTILTKPLWFMMHLSDGFKLKMEVTTTGNGCPLRASNGTSPSQRHNDTTTTILE